MSKNNRANRRRKQRVKAKLQKNTRPLEDTAQVRQWSAVSTMLLQAAKPVTAEPVGPGSILVDGGTRGQLFVDKDAADELLLGLQSQLGLSRKETVDALVALQRGGLIRCVDAEPQA